MSCNVRVHEVHLQYSRASTDKILRVSSCMKTNEIALQKALQDLMADWEDAEHIRAWKWSMQEKAYADGFARLQGLFPQHRRQQHQMIVVDPDEISI
jgi:hypothetical protein